MCVGPLAPSVPSPPPPPTPPPAPVISPPTDISDAETQGATRAAAERQRRRQAALARSDSTVLTSGLGLTDSPATTTKTVLGA